MMKVLLISIIFITAIFASVSITAYVTEPKIQIEKRLTEIS